MHLGKLGEQIVLKSPKAFEKIKYIGYETINASEYYPKKVERDKAARREYRESKRAVSSTDEIFILDIMRERMTHGDSRLR